MNRKTTIVIGFMATVLLARPCRAASAGEGPPWFLTVTRKVHRSYRSLGHKKDDLTHQTYWFAETPMDYPPTIADLEAWTFRASGEYVHVRVLLWRQTKDPQYLAAAREIADRELANLRQIEYPERWRMRERTALLDGLLALHAALAENRNPRR